MKLRPTRQNTITITVGTSPLEVLPPNEKRCAIVMSPNAAFGSGVVAAIAQSILTVGSSTWTVPNGVTSVLDAYAWGTGGNPGASGGALGGGGGGGASWIGTGPRTVTPFSQWRIFIGSPGDASATTITDASATVIGNAGDGLNGVLDIGGVGGTPAVGALQQAGGNGSNSTGLGGTGAGGGGSAGNYSAGGAAGGITGGVAGGAAVLLGYGAGAAGSNGQTASTAGIVGGSPGAGGGGGGKNAGTAAGGGVGQVVIIYAMSIAGQSISMSPRGDVAAGFGTLNFTPGQALPTVISDEDIGNAIGLPWFIVSGVAGVVVQITEYFYDD